MHNTQQSRIPYTAVIPAGGSGQRMQQGTSSAASRLSKSATSKQLLKLAGLTVLQHAVAPFLQDGDCQAVVIAAPASELERITALFDDPRIVIIRGGQSRMNSVRLGLNALHGDYPEDSWVMVHDAARANLYSSDLDKLKIAVEHEAYGGILAVPARDTLKQAESGCILKTLERETIWQALTPQMFRLGKLYEAMNLAFTEGFEVTDESSAMEYMGARVILVEGRPDNIKLTYSEDLPIMENLIVKKMSLDAGVS